MLRIWLVLIIVCSAIAAVADPAPVTIWQKETRLQPQAGDVVSLNRGPFYLIFGLEEQGTVSLLAAEGEISNTAEAFGPGRAMAGPYDGLYLTPQAYHYFFVDLEDSPPRMSLWDPHRELYFFKVQKLFDNTGDSPHPLTWQEVQDLDLIVRKEGESDIRFTIHWKR